MTRPDLVARGAANPQTIREHLRDMREEADTMRARLSLAWLESDRDAVERIVGHAVAALDLLNNAEPHEWWDNRTEHTSENPWVGRLVLDPAPRGDAE